MSALASWLDIPSLLHHICESDVPLSHARSYITSELWLLHAWLPRVLYPTQLKAAFQRPMRLP